MIWTSNKVHCANKALVYSSRFLHYMLWADTSHTAHLSPSSPYHNWTIIAWTHVHWADMLQTRRIRQGEEGTQGNGWSTPIPQYSTSLIQINAPTNYNLQISPPPHLFRSDKEVNLLFIVSRQCFSTRRRGFCPHQRIETCFRREGEGRTLTAASKSTWFGG